VIQKKGGLDTHLMHDFVMIVLRSLQPEPIGAEQSTTSKYPPITKCLLKMALICNQNRFQKTLLSYNNLHARQQIVRGFGQASLLSPQIHSLPSSRLGYDGNIHIR